MGIGRGFSFVEAYKVAVNDVERSLRNWLVIPKNYKITPHDSSLVAIIVSHIFKLRINVKEERNNFL